MGDLGGPREKSWGAYDPDIYINIYKIVNKKVRYSGWGEKQS